MEVKVKQIGTVDILRARTYKLDGQVNDPLSASVWVDPGTYELLTDGLSVFWILDGKLNYAPWHNAGGGLLISQPDGDNPVDIAVRVPSHFFAISEFLDLMNDEELTKGAGQRLIFKVDAEWLEANTEDTVTSEK